VLQTAKSFVKIAKLPTDYSNSTSFSETKCLDNVNYIYSYGVLVLIIKICAAKKYSRFESEVNHKIMYLKNKNKTNLS